MKESIESLRKVLRRQLWNSSFLFDKSACQSRTITNQSKTIISVQLQGLLTRIALIRPARQKKNPIYNKFYQNIPRNFFMFKMNKMEDHYLWIEYRNQNFESPYLKQTPFKYSKEKFASEINHFVVYLN